MTKTAAIILNHNMPDYTDMLYNSLKPYERKDYDLLVLDNGSKPEGISKYTSLRLDSNIYFGGGLNASLDFIKKSPQYDSLLFLSNDLTIHSYNFVRTLREEMFEFRFPADKDGFIAVGRNVNDVPFYDIVAPSFYNVEAEQQCHWKVMHSRCSKEIRRVDYVDFQCPLISRRLVEAVGVIDHDLVMGWGPDWLFALTAKKLGYKFNKNVRTMSL